MSLTRFLPLSLPVFSLGLLSVACGSAPTTTTATQTTAAPAYPLFDSEPTPTWPVPASWKSETIPFPLPFAPSLAYHGVEELRFAPRFFDAKADTYFSYSFAWILDDAREGPISAGRLSEDLGRYFAGLAHAVDGAHYDANAHEARLALSGIRYRGTVRTVDAFGGSRPLSLNVDGEQILCGKRRVLLLSLSPQPFGHATWSALASQRATFACRV
jgi:hypothetical protein